MARRKELQECPVRCGRRHYPDHPHMEGKGMEEKFAREPATDENDETRAGRVSVVGADSPESLGAQAEQAVSGKGGPRLIQTKQQVEQQLAAARREATRPLARQLAIIPYSTVAIASGDKRWREKLRDESINALEQATLNAMMAWGIEFSGKWSSLAALCVVHAETLGTMARDIMREDAVEKETKDEKKPSVN